MRSEAPIIPKTILLAGVFIASIIVLLWLLRNAIYRNSGSEFFFVLHGAAILLSLVWMVRAHYPSLFAISMRGPGVLQVGLEVAVLSSIAFAIPWVISRAEWGPFTPAPWGVLLLILSIPMAAVWVGVRTRLRARAYVVAQSMLAALCFYPVWVLGTSFLGFAIDPGFWGLREPWIGAVRNAQTTLILIGGPFFAAVALIVAEVARQIPRLRNTQP